MPQHDVRHESETPPALRPAADGGIEPKPDHPRTSPADGFWIAEQVEDLVSKLIGISGVESVPGGAVFHGRPETTAGTGFDSVAAEANARGYDLLLLEPERGKATVLATPVRSDPTLRSRPAWNAVLLLATLATTTWAGALHQGVNLLLEPGRWTLGLPYALALLGILGVHEMGHFLVARRRGVQVTLPYFIPAPFFLGTFGAFIRMSSRVRDRATFFDVAVAGPLAGLVAALAALVLGLAFGSTAVGHGMNPRSSTLVYAVYRLTGGDPGAGLVEFGAVAFAGWLGIVITALNLIPVGQLDGGHIAYALLGGRRAATVGAVLLGLLVAGGLFYSPHLLMWAVVVWAIAGLRHPPAQNEFAPLGAARTALACGTLALLVAIVLPWPL